MKSENQRPKIKVPLQTKFNPSLCCVSQRALKALPEKTVYMGSHPDMGRITKNIKLISGLVYLCNATEFTAKTSGYSYARLDIKGNNYVDHEVYVSPVTWGKVKMNFDNNGDVLLYIDGIVEQKRDSDELEIKLGDSQLLKPIERDSGCKQTPTFVSTRGIQILRQLNEYEKGQLTRKYGKHGKNGVDNLTYQIIVNIDEDCDNESREGTVNDYFPSKLGELDIEVF